MMGTSVLNDVQVRSELVAWLSGLRPGDGRSRITDSLTGTEHTELILPQGTNLHRCSTLCCPL